MVGNRGFTLTPRNTDSLEWYLGKLGFVNLYPFKIKTLCVMDSRAHQLHISNNFWDKTNKAVARKKVKINSLVRFRGKQEGLGGWRSWLFTFNLSGMGKELSHCFFLCLLQVPRQGLKWPIQNMWSLFISGVVFAVQSLTFHMNLKK